MLDRVKNGSPYVAVKRRVLQNENNKEGLTCLWAEHTQHTHTHGRYEVFPAMTIQLGSGMFSQRESI